ncbi:MAG TPA: helix-turn-helix domain-containing protein [Thermoleophilaceae bacterium]|nr:helix-turn-helix domain-containing protein [Thermoleophilaceae bacterium]
MAQQPDPALAPPFTAALGSIAEAVESGAGLPEVARACGRALDASVAVVDASSRVLAVACASPEDERAVLAGEAGSEQLDLTLGEARVGRLHLRERGEPNSPDLIRVVAAILALELDRTRAPERASEAAVRDLLEDIVARRLTDRENIVARGTELGADLGGGGSVIVARAVPQQPEEGDWPARVLAVAERGARAVERTCLLGAVELRPGGEPMDIDGRDRAGEVVVLVPSPDGEVARRVIGGVRRELEAGLPSFALALGRSRVAGDPADLYRAAAEALLAANVAQAQGGLALNFEETGAYRLLLSSMTDNPAELRSFHDETVAPLVAYDEQYETELVRTLETFLDEDGNVAQTAQRLFTHRHTIRYRLERVKELTELDVSSTDGRERLGLGLKAMRVLGIVPPHGPMSEAGAETGRVPGAEKDR